jgi:molybdopterin-guanine dinucleotide biosynthesis protein A
MIDATGFITAGGRSSRMGQDKAWLQLGGRAMIEHVIDALAPVSSVTIIADNPRYLRLGLPVVSDHNSGVGPLEAIRTAMSHATTSRIVLVGCDLPFVTSELFKRLLSISGSDAATVPVGPDGRLEPLCAIYRPEALPIVTNLISEGVRKVSLLFDRVPTRFVGFDELVDLKDSELFFENINTPDDYDRAVQKLLEHRRTV